MNKVYTKLVHPQHLPVQHLSTIAHLENHLTKEGELHRKLLSKEGLSEEFPDHDLTSRSSAMCEIVKNMSFVIKDIELHSIPVTKDKKIPGMQRRYIFYSAHTMAHDFFENHVKPKFMKEYENKMKVYIIGSSGKTSDRPDLYTIRDVLLPLDDGEFPEEEDQTQKIFNVAQNCYFQSLRIALFSVVDTLLRYSPLYKSVIMKNKNEHEKILSCNELANHVMKLIIQNSEHNEDMDESHQIDHHLLETIEEHIQRHLK